MNKKQCEMQFGHTQKTLAFSDVIYGVCVSLTSLIGCLFANLAIYSPVTFIENENSKRKSSWGYRGGDLGAQLTEYQSWKRNKEDLCSFASNINSQSTSNFLTDAYKNDALIDLNALCEYLSGAAKKFDLIYCIIAGSVLHFLFCILILVIFKRQQTRSDRSLLCPALCFLVIAVSAGIIIGVAIFLTLEMLKLNALGITVKRSLGFYWMLLGITDIGISTIFTFIKICTFLKKKMVNEAELDYYTLSHISDDLFCTSRKPKHAKPQPKRSAFLSTLTPYEAKLGQIHTSSSNKPRKSHLITVNSNDMYKNILISPVATAQYHYNAAPFMMKPERKEFNRQSNIENFKDRKHFGDFPFQASQFDTHHLRKSY